MLHKQETLPLGQDSLVITHNAPDGARGLCGPFELAGPAAACLLSDPVGEEALVNFYCPYLRLARGLGSGMLLESPTARASRTWISALGLGRQDPMALNRQAVAFVSQLRDFFDPAGGFVRLGGAVGPGSALRGAEVTREEALLHHFEQVEILAAAGVDLIVASAMPTVAEAIGLTMAAAAMERPILVYLAVDRWGRMACGRPLDEAVAMIDDAVPQDARPLFYGLDCRDLVAAERALAGTGQAAARVRGVRVAGPMLQQPDHGEQGLGLQSRGQDTPAALRARFPNLQLVGGAFESKPGLLDRPLRRLAAA